MKTEPPVTIRVQLRELAQLFNSMDPSPFHDRDLDGDAEEYIVGWARELPRTPPIDLVIHLGVPPLAERAGQVEAAVRHYFAARADIRQRAFRQLMRRGRTSLAVGLGFLMSCLAAGELLTTLGHGTAAVIIKESLVIGGWVAMWRPLEIFLYDWWPVKEELRVLERLARMNVKLVVNGVSADGPAAPAQA